MSPIKRCLLQKAEEMLLISLFLTRLKAEEIFSNKLLLIVVGDILMTPYTQKLITIDLVLM